ncbi:bifunctional diaminohydroxyphosphoribosylaminopyrimidine deaminase/5-amino-6-(5-phosphoribosylamino)uracil reductase RibD [Streptomyces sp. RK31]|uniref:bifunctional diaminohydroxyphosphoribosylaminopyrimidine deaminase/5-amino-6-(5-phosphoribosylamino)uracil reductase RibD n=1 Tax=Streptomyces sp. RK31 TaxID=2824892 RepID=UPI001B375EF9|nr:bifunctional diaminohydroxyphosphoribosylaminopyrimidine deaminase/5-amino-6-(5-phosphoribosylamino)uracil reductase RibD [Streptomyces sp. RK31]MBQ0972915.1 bifunctional diaminohydroxyphosphoribosylaminopyrimidine deaminase/5-amino-6-(5-phosphoribosylamino)uracil reductase RibD [Streptomyces sp. RK31]
MPTSVELAAMRRAIVISASGLGATSPNPAVGCVILDAAGRTVGEGYHLRKGDPHAEVNALAAASARAAGGTAVVTLEPCNHEGLTPACHQALLDAKIARVLIAVMDPTSRGEGGAARLRKAGVDVQTHVLEEEALVVLGPWRTSLSHQRPVLHLMLQTDPAGQPTTPTTEALAQLALERQAHDLLISPDGSAEEGQIGSHGRRFSVPAHPVPDEPGDTVAALTEAGARTVLLVGPSKLSERLLSEALVDRLTLLVPVPEPSQATTTTPAPLLPDGYVLSRITRVGSQLVISAGRR